MLRNPGVDHVAFVLDGEVQINITRGTTPAPVFWDVPFYLIMNTAIGGGWPGPPNATTRWPIQHLIEYVRVSRRAKTPPVVAVGHVATGCNIRMNANCNHNDRATPLVSNPYYAQFLIRWMFSGYGFAMSAHITSILACFSPQIRDSRL